MFRLHAINAFFGDALLLEYGTAPDPRFLLVDGGPPHTWSHHLHSVLRQVKQKGRDLDLVMLSHADNDHVIGLVDYLAELQAGTAGLPLPQALWHNSFNAAMDPGGTLSVRFQNMMTGVRAQAMGSAAIAVNGIAEANSLRLKALTLGVPINPGAPDGLITVDDAGAPWQSANLTLHVVGPTKANLKALQDEWEAWLTEHEGDVDPYVMANADRSIPNLSSIMVLATADGKRLLLTGDGRSDHLLDGLDMAGLLDAQGALHVDVLKLAHHGSDRNVTKTFFRKVTANVYVASADGTNDNPDLATLIWIVEAAQAAGRQIRLVVTNQTQSTERLQSEYPAADYGYTLDVRDPAQNAITIDLA